MTGNGHYATMPWPWGGWGRANWVFGGALDGLLLELNRELVAA